MCIRDRYRIEKSDKEPFAVRFEELLGWFIIPKLYEKCSWAQYDMPVSYTHLDVYKRQQHNRFRIVGAFPGDLVEKGGRVGRGVGPDPVSYTHLDVYKRQRTSTMFGESRRARRGRWQRRWESPTRRCV